MEKRVFLLVALVFGSGLILMAQPNFTYADYPNIGHNDSLYHNPVYAPVADLDLETGANYNWSFPDLTFNEIFWAVDSFRVKTHPVSEPFTEASIEYFHQEASGNNLELYSFEQDTLYLHRTGSTVGGTAFVPPVSAIGFPMTFGQLSVVNQPLLFGEAIIGERTSSINYDGFGTLNLPDGSVSNNVFRLKSIVTDSTFSTGFVTSYVSYTWYAQGGEIPLLRLFKIDFAGIEATFYNAYARKNTGVTLVSEVNPMQITIFPNPASETISVSGLKPNSTYFIFNQHGAMVKSGFIKESAIISVSELKSGTYFLISEGISKKFVKS